MDKKLKSKLQIGAVILGASVASYFMSSNSRTDTEKRVIFKYNEKAAKQDSIYSLYLAKAVYAYYAQTEKDDAVLKKFSQNDLWKFDKNYVLKNAETDESCDIKALCDSARDRNVKYVIFSATEENGFYAADTADLRELLSYSEKERMAQGLKPFMLCVKFTEEDNAWVEQEAQADEDVALGVSIMTEFEKGVTYAVLRHEIGHFAARKNLKDIERYKFPGHGKGVSNLMIDSAVNEEGYCDHKHTARGMTAKDLVGLSWFFLRQNYEENALFILLGDKKENAIHRLATLIYKINKREVEELSTHPPTLYRFVNMAAVAGIDITTIAETFEKRDTVSQLASQMKND